MYAHAIYTCTDMFDMSIVRLSFPVFLQPTTKLFIDGKFVESNTSEWLDIHNPVSISALTHTTMGVHANTKKQCINRSEAGDEELFRGSFNMYDLESEEMGAYSL